jgi:hypothetical protein
VVAGNYRSCRWRGPLPEDSPDHIATKRSQFESARAARLHYAWGEAADLYIGAFLLPRTGHPPVMGAAPIIPTSGDVWRALGNRQVHPPLVARAGEVSHQARAFHWPLEFPDVVAAGGFHVMLGNPPWDVVQLVEEEYFAQLRPEISDLPAAERANAIEALRVGPESSYRIAELSQHQAD